MITKQELFDLLPSIYESMHLPLFPLDERYRILHQHDAFLHLSQDFFVEIAKQVDLIRYKCFTKFTKSEYYHFFPCRISGIPMIVIGPFLYHKPLRNTSVSHIEFFQRAGIFTADEALLQKFPDSGKQYYHKLSFLYQLVNQEFLSEDELRASYKKSPMEEPAVIQDMEKELFTQRENEESTLSYHIEQEMLNHLKKADSVKARISMQAMLHNGSIHSLSINSMRSAQYSFVAAITLFTRAVIQVNVPIVQAYAMSDVYIKRVDAMISKQQVQNLLNEAILDYTRLVKRYQNVSDPKWIRQCKEYIAEHLHEDIRLDDLADVVHRNASYISAQFKKLTKTSLKEYIHILRIKEAMYLLQNTTLPLQDIAISLQYNSQDYFSKVFKKYTGILPSDYRNNPKQTPLSF